VDVSATLLIMAARCAAKREFGVNPIVAFLFPSVPILTPFRRAYKMYPGFGSLSATGRALGGTT
jgi:hypothetical protein